MLFAPTGALEAALVIFMFASASALLLTALLSLGRSANWQWVAYVEARPQLRQALRWAPLAFLVLPVLLLAARPLLQASGDQQSSETATRQQLVTRSPVLLFGELVAPAGSELVRGWWSEDFQYPAQARFAEPITWQGLRLNALFWESDQAGEGGQLVAELAMPSEVDGWLCSQRVVFSQPRVTQSTLPAGAPAFDLKHPPQLARCHLAAMMAQGNDVLPAGTEIQREQQWRCISTPCVAREPLTVWQATPPAAPEGTAWQGRRWHDLVLQIERGNVAIRSGTPLR
ncbi:hypothetical protein ACTSKR_02255 [Chitinibacteraceae bacterium HSL-7]